MKADMMIEYSNLQKVVLPNVCLTLKKRSCPETSSGMAEGARRRRLQTERCDAPASWSNATIREGVLGSGSPPELCTYNYLILA